MAKLNFEKQLSRLEEIVEKLEEEQTDLDASVKLFEEGIDARVISMPCMELFKKQSKKYKESVMPTSVKARVCVEAGCEAYWHKYATDNGEIICINEFGKSGPAEELFEQYGFTVENICEKAKKSIQRLISLGTNMI